MTLSTWKRIKRRLSLMGGSYKHPDGYIELDFEADAGVVRGDSDAIKEHKFAMHAARQRKWQKFHGAVLVGAAACYLAASMAIPMIDAIAIAALTGWGLFLLVQ
jgi:hypothetical protein